MRLRWRKLTEDEVAERERNGGPYLLMRVQWEDEPVPVILETESEQTGLREEVEYHEQSSR